MINSGISSTSSTAFLTSLKPSTQLFIEATLRNCSCAFSGFSQKSGARVLSSSFWRSIFLCSMSKTPPQRIQTPYNLFNLFCLNHKSVFCFIVIFFFCKAPHCAFLSITGYRSRYPRELSTLCHFRLLSLRHYCRVSFSIPKWVPRISFPLFVPPLRLGIVFDTQVSRGIYFVITHYCRVSFSIPTRMVFFLLRAPYCWVSFSTPKRG